MKTSIKVKIIVPLIIFCITLVGQLFHLVIIEKSDSNFLLLIFTSYSLIISLIGYFIIDFIKATGHIQRKIRIVKLLILYFVILIVVNSYLITDPDLNIFLSKIQLTLTTLLVIFIIVVDNIFKQARDFDIIPDVRQLPQKYLGVHLIRTILETIFRLFPLPEPIALYRVGNPDNKSPVIVTGNYELTVRRVAKSLIGLDCWLLICDSRGINVWCSSLSGHFSEKNIIQAIELTNLSKYISHKRLILPQLCAPGVDIQTIKEETKFTSVFGPVYIEYIKVFLKKSRNESELRNVNFDLKQRIEMAIGSPIILAVVLAFSYLFIDLSKLLFILPVLYFLAIVHAIIYPYRIIKNIPLWAALYSLSTIGGVIFITSYLNIDWSFGIAAILGIGIFYLINEFEGWSPLVKYNLKSIYKGIKSPEITVNEELCDGCRLCFKVCPKGVFTIENGKAKVLNKMECIECSACYYQCPTEAIHHSSNKNKKEKCACVYCNIQDKLKE